MHSSRINSKIIHIKIKALIVISIGKNRKLIIWRKCSMIYMKKSRIESKIISKFSIEIKNVSNRLSIS